MKVKTNTFILLSIILIAFFLRFYALSSIPFTHDEFSALFRTHFSNFKELIEKGVKVDGHPALIQVFLYYYTKLFGYTEWVVKLPFLIAGVTSVYLIYLLGRKWFSESAGLVCAAMMATLEYPVMYSQIARPYVSGLFLTLLMVLFWNQVIFQSQRRFFLNLSLYLIFSVLCVYNHYFSFLLAIIVGFTGLFFISRQKLGWYILSGTTIFLLFLPYLPIFLYQLSLGGVGGWLGKPANDFLFQYLGYIFHFSWLVITLVALLILSGIWKNRNRKADFLRNVFFLISAGWFLLPLTIGFFYSKFVNPVLQESCLIFSFPFLLFALFGYIGKLPWKTNIIIILGILMVNTLSLYFERDYYTLFYNSPYQRIVEQTAYAQKRLGASNVISIIDSHKGISEYYLKKEKLDSNFLWYNSFPNKKDFETFIGAQKSEYLTYGCISGEDRVAPFIITAYYPYLIQYNNYFNGDFYIYSKHESSKNNSFTGYKNEFGFEGSSKNWAIPKVEYITDSLAHTGKYSYHLPQGLEFGPVYEEKLNSIIKHRNDYIDVTCWCQSKDALKDVMLVVTLKSGNKMLEWMATDLESFQVKVNDGWFKIYYSVKLADIRLNHINIILNAYIWNMGKKNLVIDDFIVKQRDGNPSLYGLFKKL